MKFVSLCLFSFFLFHFSFSQTISTFAGTDTGGFSGDGGPATAAELGTPPGVASDDSGNIYISDLYAKRIRKVNTFGIISTIAGSGYAGGYTGDGGPATKAGLYFPVAVEVSNSGNIYIADAVSNVIRMVNHGDTIIRFAGNGAPFGYGGDGGPATAANLFRPTGIAIDTFGNVYIADLGNCEIRKVNTSGIITRIAGCLFSNYSGDGGPATAAELNGPCGVALDIFRNIYIADCSNQRIRKINTSGIINTIVGNGVAGFWGDGGDARDAELNEPQYIEVDTYGNVYFSDFANNRIRRVNTSGIISTIAGNGIAGFSGDGGPPTEAELNEPYGIALDASGNLYIADQNNSRIRKVTDVASIKGVTSSITMALFPNPNNGTFTLLLSNFNEKCNIEIYTILGQKIYTTTFPTPIGGGASIYSTQIHLFSVSSGVYVYRVQKEDGSLVGEGKVIIEK